MNFKSQYSNYSKLELKQVVFCFSKYKNEVVEITLLVTDEI